MIKHLIILAALALVSCGHRHKYVVKTEPGKPGPKGEVGEIGPAGPAGNPGAPGSGCTVVSVSPSALAPNGGSLITCGSSSTIVHNGAQGQQGSQGPQGPAGNSGTPVSFVKFCPNVTTSYPSTFPEYGICLGGQIYAVYWNQGPNTAFGTVLPPGTYVTTSVNQNCTFIITANSCVIGH